MLFCTLFFHEFSNRFLRHFFSNYMFFRSARKGRRRLKYCKNQYIFDVFRIARLRRRRGEGQEQRENRMLNQLQKTLKICCFSYFFRAGRPSRKNTPKMTSQSHSGTLPGSLREGEIDQLFAPGGPQAANNEFLGAPGPPRASPGRLRGGSGSRVGAQGPPRGLQGGILEGFWIIFASIF